MKACGSTIAWSSSSRGARGRSAKALSEHRPVLERAARGAAPRRSRKTTPGPAARRKGWQASYVRVCRRVQRRPRIATATEPGLALDLELNLETETRAIRQRSVSETRLAAQSGLEIPDLDFVGSVPPPRLVSVPPVSSSPPLASQPPSTGEIEMDAGEFADFKIDLPEEDAFHQKRGLGGRSPQASSPALPAVDPPTSERLSSPDGSRTRGVKRLNPRHRWSPRRPSRAGPIAPPSSSRRRAARTFPLRPASSSRRSCRSLRPALR